MAGLYVGGNEPPGFLKVNAVLARWRRSNPNRRRCLTGFKNATSRRHSKNGRHVGISVYLPKYFEGDGSHFKSGICGVERRNRPLRKWYVGGLGPMTALGGGIACNRLQDNFYLSSTLTTSILPRSGLELMLPAIHSGTDKLRPHMRDVTPQILRRIIDTLLYVPM
ncbi:hypothetical protein ANN_08186 [Periplaneta americana]|uniref:Uncharacterized protein n=1 Tax=Periplaneta americana TaxID=6978 RepID=A0ABQ8T2Y7_PERAM|nr:hypothetical protein ANN_08186 [Periplaneta americana]